MAKTTTTGFIALLSGDGGDTGRRGATATEEARHGATSTSGVPLVNVASRKRRHRPSSDRTLRSARPSSFQRDGYPAATGEPRRRQERHGAALRRRGWARHGGDGRGAARQRSAGAEALDGLGVLQAAGRLMVLPPAQRRPNGYGETLRRQGR